MNRFCKSIASIFKRKVVNEINKSKYYRRIKASHYLEIYTCAICGERDSLLVDSINRSINSQARGVINITCDYCGFIAQFDQEHLDRAFVTVPNNSPSDATEIKEIRIKF